MRRDERNHYTGHVHVLWPKHDRFDTNFGETTKNIAREMACQGTCSNCFSVSIIAQSKELKRQSFSSLIVAYTHTVHGHPPIFRFSLKRHKEYKMSQSIFLTTRTNDRDYEDETISHVRC